ncbi:hypothetical protein [Nostoc sp. MS1]|uniref:hypothetical protein n=1 Tax=Nostoc sp. MS1 TaxID=2764711 RepID=UPI001CC43DB9|nr:hypothetical protein [Nostoc sp. MS1]
MESLIRLPQDDGLTSGLLTQKISAINGGCDAHFKEGFRGVQSGYGIGSRKTSPILA